jgi:hypothetical protein
VSVQVAVGRIAPGLLLAKITLATSRIRVPADQAIGPQPCGRGGLQPGHADQVTTGGNVMSLNQPFGDQPAAQIAASAVVLEPPLRAVISL